MEVDRGALRSSGKIPVAPLLQHKNVSNAQHNMWMLPNINPSMFFIKKLFFKKPPNTGIFSSPSDTFVALNPKRTFLAPEANVDYMHFLFFCFSFFFSLSLSLSPSLSFSLASPPLFAKPKKKKLFKKKPKNKTKSSFSARNPFLSSRNSPLRTK